MKHLELITRIIISKENKDQNPFGQSGFVFEIIR
jgi:hypothetical protein